MKILLFLGDVKFINSFGGAEKVACLMANEFSSRGNKMIIVCNDPASGRPVYPLEPEVVLYNINGTGRKRSLVPLSIEIGRGLLLPFKGSNLYQRLENYRSQVKEKNLARYIEPIIKREQPDIIVSFFCEGLTALYYSPSANNIPIIQMLHSTPSRAIRNRSQIQTQMFQRCRAIQVLLLDYVSEMKEYENIKVVVIPNSVEIPEQSVEYRSGSHGRIICIGRLEPGKQQHILIESFLHLSDRFPDWRLYLFGDARKSYLKKIKKILAEKDRNSRVFIEGTTKEPQKELRNSDIFAFPSLFEGFPLALSEAMALGLPVLGFQNTPGVNSLVLNETNGLLASNPYDFEQKLQCLMENSELRRQLGQQARISMQTYAPESVWNSWNQLFLSLF